jgi:Lrp/AsnC family transcriptional regulator for asnA, asnC and gidA
MIYHLRSLKMDENYQIDSLDRKILRMMRQDSRKPFLEIARELKVAGGTIHSRVGKMRESGVISGSRLLINHKALGYNVHAFIGVDVSRAGQFKQVLESLEKLPEVIEVHYTTGGYSLLVKAAVKMMEDRHILLSEKIQAIPDISSTETFIILNTPVDREIEP